MIRINKGVTNSCVFTLTENTTLTNANYIINFYSNQNHNNKLMFLNNDLSSNPIRYNLYDIYETSSEDLYNQKIELETTSYDYFVYETISATLSLDFAGDLVEKGKAVVIDDNDNDSTFDDNSNEYTFQ